MKVVSGTFEKDTVQVTQNRLHVADHALFGGVFWLLVINVLQLATLIFIAVK